AWLFSSSGHGHLKRHRRDRSSAFFISSNTALSATTILRIYTLRWECELGNWWLKQSLGLGDYRVRSLDAILRWHALVFVAYAFLGVRRAETYRPGKPLAPFANMLNEHRKWHFRQLVQHIAGLARNGRSDQPILESVAPTLSALRARRSSSQFRPQPGRALLRLITA
ncbi:MAG: transposase, partial [Thermoflexales bacterium]